MEVEHARRGPAVAFGRVDLDLPQGGEQRIRVLTRMQFLTAFQDADILARARNSSGRDRAAIPRAHHDH